jgi:hypothetical protein
MLDHVSVELPWAGTTMGLAEIDTMGGWVGALLESPACSLSPHPTAARPRIPANATSPMLLMQLLSVRSVFVFISICSTWGGRHRPRPKLGQSAPAMPWPSS